MPPREPGALRDERLRLAADYVRQPEPLAPAQRDALLPAELRERRLDELHPDAWPALLHEWRYWARPTQLAPVGVGWVIWLILAGRGWGKLLCVDTPIPTPAGWSTMGALRVGDVVYDESGRRCNVTGAFDVEVPEVCYRLHFSDGTWIDAADSHEWVTWTHAERKAFLRSPYEDATRPPPEWPAWRLKRRPGGTDLPRETIEEALRLKACGRSARRIEKDLGVCRQAIAKHLRAGSHVERGAVAHDDAPGPRIRTTQAIADTLTHGKRGDVNHSIPVCGALHGETIRLPVHPYALGAWLGDGHTNGACITIGDADAPEMLGMLKAVGVDAIPYRRAETRTGARSYGIGKGWLVAALRALGVFGGKHIPAAIFRADVEQRLALLRGLMDTDGHAWEGGSKVEFCSTNERLALGVVELARSLGQKPTLARTRATLNGRDVGPKFRVTWRPTVQVFGMKRKADRVVLGGAQAHRNHHRMIVRVERIESKPMRCITVDSPHRMYLAGEGMIPTHNSRTGIEWIREGVDDGTGFPFGLIGPTRNDTYDRLVYGEDSAPGLVRLYEHFPERLQPKVNSQRNTITFPGFDGRPEAMGYIFTAEKPEVRGPNMRRWLCDELATWPYLRACWDNIEMTTRAAGKTPPRICVSTTPRPLEVLKELLDDPRVAVTFGSTFANAANLAASWVERMARKYGTGRLGAQELFGLLLGDNPDALYHQTTIDRHALRDGKHPPFTHITIGVDNAIATSKRNDLTGIVAVGLDAAKHLYPLIDLSGADWDRSKKGLAYWHPDDPKRHKPDEWAELVCRLYYHLRATYPDAKVRVAAERNRGGDLVKSNVIQVDRLTGGGGAIPIVDPETRDSKGEMHENLSTAYENGLVHHVGNLPKMEAEMVEWNPRGPGPSPNRADALRIACTDLCPEIWREVEPDPVQVARSQLTGLADMNRAIVAGLSTPGGGTAEDPHAPRRQAPSPRPAVPLAGIVGGFGGANGWTGGGGTL